ncbi:MAG: hypothetical protein H6577_17020 [Lewinellaceae bacterium]|nr:hypothetical protein [Lewinellaceae bacterium]
MAQQTGTGKLASRADRFGVAIFGSLQLPGLLERIGEFAMTFFSLENFTMLYLFFNYAFIAVYVIIIGFVLHFVLRALWIGLIGLNSVFPEGINVEGGYYPRHFMEKNRPGFPE